MIPDNSPKKSHIWFAACPNTWRCCHQLYGHSNMLGWIVLVIEELRCHNTPGGSILLLRQCGGVVFGIRGRSTDVASPVDPKQHRFWGTGWAGAGRPNIQGQAVLPGGKIPTPMSWLKSQLWLNNYSKWILWLRKSLRHTQLNHGLLSMATSRRGAIRI